VKPRNVNRLDGVLKERMKAGFDSWRRPHTGPLIAALALEVIQMIKELMNGLFFH